MRSSRNKQVYIRAGITAFCVIAASMIFFYIVYNNASFKTAVGNFFTVLRPVLYGLIIAYLLNPLMQFLENLILRLLKVFKCTPARGARILIRLLSIFLAVFFFFLVIYILMAMLVPELIDSITGIINNYQTYEKNVIDWVNTTFSGNESASETTADLMVYADRFYTWVTEKLPDVESIVTNVTKSVVSIFIVLKDLLLGFIISIYVLSAKERIAAKGKRFLYAVVSIPAGNRVLHNLRFVDEKFGGFIIGKVIDSAIIGVICYICVSIMRMPYPMLISVVIGVTNVIPFFGPFIGAIPCAVLVFVVDPMKAIYFIIFIIALQQFDGNILGPYILGNSTGLSGLLVVIAIILCNNIFGITGAFFGVPLVATIVGLVQSLIRKQMERKNLPKDLSYYDDLTGIEEKSLAAQYSGEEDKGTSLYDRIKYQDRTLAEGGLSRFQKPETGSGRRGIDLPEDPVNVTDEEAALNHNIPLVRK